jgi:hypothetical protein
MAVEEGNRAAVVDKIKKDGSGLLREQNTLLCGLIELATEPQAHTDEGWAALVLEWRPTQEHPYEHPDGTRCDGRGPAGA